VEEDTAVEEELESLEIEDEESFTNPNRDISKISFVDDPKYEQEKSDKSASYTGESIEVQQEEDLGHGAPD
jgi:hypothetical protein